jgi:hypothetical protein
LEERNFLEGRTSAPQNQRRNVTFIMTESQEEFKRQLMILEHCLLLGMLYYDEGNESRGERYLDLAKQYYQTAVEQARSGCTLLPTESSSGKKSYQRIEIGALS